MLMVISEYGHMGRFLSADVSFQHNRLNVLLEAEFTHFQVHFSSSMLFEASSPRSAVYEKADFFFRE